MDGIDMFQRGLGQTLGGDLETVGQIADSQGLKDAGRGVSAWADGQLQEVSTPMREAMGKQFFQENAETGAIEAGDAWADPRAWAGNFATVLGQFTGLVGGTKGAGVLAKPVLRGAGKLLAKDLVEGQARELVAKATVKDAIQAGALDSVRAAYLAAPSEAAKRAVLDKAIGRLTSIGYGAHAGAMASGMRAQQAEQEARGFLNGLGNDELNANPIYQQAFWDLADGEMQGASVGDIRRAAIDSIAEKAATDAWSDPRALSADFLSGMLTGAGGGVGGVLGKVGTTRAGAAARGFVGEGATEAWQGGETQRAVNQAVQEWADETRDPMAGVLSSALNEGTLGGAFGGVVGGVRGPEAQAASKPVVRVERRVVTGDEQMDDMIHGLDQRQAERGASISSEIDSMFAGARNPLMPGQSDAVMDIPAYQRQAEIPVAEELVPVAAPVVEQQAETAAAPLAAPIPQADMPAFRQVDPIEETPAFLRQSIARAGSETDSVFGPLKTMRITRSGKPFATEKEAAMASRKGQEMPVPLNGGGFGVAAIGEVQQAQAQQGAVKQPSSNSAQQDRQDGKTEIAQNGMVIVHGSGNPGMSEQDIQIVRASGQKQGKKGRVYGGFYGTSEQDAHQAQAYADMMGGTPTLYDVKIKPGTKVLHKQGDITRLSESYINELVSQGYGVVTGTDPRGQTEHVVIDKSAVASMAPRGAQATPSQVNDTNVADIRQPSDQPAASVSAETVPAPSATAGEASQLAPAIDTGYREVIPVKQPKTEVSNEPVTPVPAISSEGQGDQHGAGEPAAAGAGPAIAGLADRAGSGDPADYAAAPPVPDGQQQNDPTLTAPATDAGVAVSEVVQPDPVAPASVAAPTPWAEAIDNPDGTITLKGDVPLIKQWAKDSGVKAMPGKGGLLVAKSSAVKVREFAAPAASEPVQQIEAARAEVAPEPTDAQKEAGNYKKGHLKLQGLDIVLENPKGSTRSGTDKDGKAWQSTMAHDYGYIKRTLGADGDHVDVFIGERPDSETVYVVDQVDPKTGKFDEHKVMMGFADEQAAQAGYLANYEKGWKGLGSIKAMPVEEFKRWVKGGDTTKPVADAAKETVRAIAFSKQAMAQGEKPAKHLTRKEAELVTKEWFKQYRGASGINVQIHATQAELEQALGLAAKDGLIRRAAFDDDNGTLHVAADTIAHPKRMREILRHEVLAHYGLANVLGDGEYTKLISRIIKSKSAPSMKAVWDWVDTHYAGEDVGVQAEEVIAHLAELEQSAWRRGWDQVVAWVTKALRTVGFVPGGITAAETRVLIEGLGKKMKRGGPDDSGPDGGQKFSQEAAQPEKKGGIKMSQSNTAADDSKTLEQSIKQKAVYQAGAALSSVKNWLKQGRPLMLGTLTDLQIDQVYRDITGGAVSQYQRLRTQMEADRNDILLDAETRIDPLWDALGKQEKADLSNLMHDATMARLHPDKSLDENSYYQEAKQKLERAKKPETRAAYEAELRTIELNHSALAKQYNALPANAKALYGTMLDTYTKQWESLRGAIEQRLEDLLGVSEGRAMAAEMRQKMEHALQHGPYFPLTRYGDYVIKARKGDEYVREHFERRADAEQAVKQYQRDGYNAVMTVKEEGSGDSANANQLGMEMLNFLDNADGVSKTALKDEIWQAMLRMMPDASYAKHAIHRRRVKGASRDAHRAYLNSVYHYARHVSKIRYGHKMQGELDKLSEQIRAGVAGEPSSLKPDDLEIAQQVLNEMNKRHDLNMNPTGKAWAGAAGNIGFLYYIGPSLASAVVNMTQNFTVMLPQLGAKYGFAKSASAMTEALRDYWRHGKFKAGTTEAWRSLTRSTTLPADERAMLERLYRSGVLDLTQAHSIAAKADTDQQDAKPMSKGWRRAMRWAGATFHNAEVLNREVAALAAYRLLKQAEPTLDGQQYADRVAEMVYDGHGNYAASNRPRYMRNDITKVLTQFKIYSQMMTYVLYSNAIKAAKGDRVAAKTLAGVLATHWVMAGVMGLPTPIAAVAYALAAAFDDDDDRSGEASFRLALTEALGPRAGELLAKGPMDAITNLSIAGRTGLGDLWWRSPKEGTEGDDLAWHAVQQLLGPVAGIGINMARGAGQMTDGHIQRGMETVLPKSIRDAAKALRQATEGEQTIKGDVIMDDVSAWNVAMQAIGFGSAQMAKNYDAREYIKGKERRIADKRSELMADYYNARKSGDMDAVQEVLDHIKMFNATHNPGERITGKSLALSFKSKLRSNERTQGGVHLNRNREYLREEGKFAEQ
ncbi:PLxRFG domain-containing protein [Aeromonas veronii]|uniref:PLxRFG domain-containing protein n=1 Tax=Aeromonas veronii TaxID=654 RepID=A0AAW5MAQ0_AERVE|nr:PLxRFG domain-containing protein [Aeromonas veronii]MCR4450658.1 PLxRFG domain-containing protein [Aeromonas veronii]